MNKAIETIKIYFKQGSTTLVLREIQLKARFHNPKMDCDCRVEARI